MYRPGADALPARQTVVQPASAGRIKHLIVVIEENRSFDNIFAGFPGADAATSGLTHTGHRVALHPILFDGEDLDHRLVDAKTQWNQGKMNGFDLTKDASGRSGLFAYGYLRRYLVRPYWDMAQRYVLADHMFPTEWGPSFSAHLDLIASTGILISEAKPNTEVEADTPLDEPWGCDAPSQTISVVMHRDGSESNGPFPCFTQFNTLADSLDAAKVSWKYYSPQVINCYHCNGGGLLWSAFDSISKVRYGSDWTANVVSPETTIFADIQDKKLPSVSWIVPKFANSDHASSKSDTGPSWVAAIVNAVGHSKYWDSTAIVVLWDDWGGWYDNAPPKQLDYQGLGLRVPCIIISPYAKAHHVSKTLYEFGSILKFAEETFGLAPIGPPSYGYTDTRATSLSDSFDFRSRPLEFETIRAKYPLSFFLSQPENDRAPDDD